MSSRTALGEGGVGLWRVVLTVVSRDTSEMPKKRGDRARQTAEQRARRERRQLARDEKLREDHARLVVERSQDPRFTQRIHRHDGSTVYRWPVDSAQHVQLREMMESQARRFRDKFGRDPGPEDPIFFDPDADEPRPRELDTVAREMTEGLRRAGRETGVDPALVEAWYELGYVVTEDNRHLFSAGDIIAWEAAVRRHEGNFGGEGDLDGENKIDEDRR
jgi:hypothetical protein